MLKSLTCQIRLIFWDVGEKKVNAGDAPFHSHLNVTQIYHLDTRNRIQELDLMFRKSEKIMQEQNNVTIQACNHVKVKKKQQP